MPRHPLVRRLGLGFYALAAACLFMAAGSAADAIFEATLGPFGDSDHLRRLVASTACLLLAAAGGVLAGLSIRRGA